jgi:hypothetical protein
MEVSRMDSGVTTGADNRETISEVKVSGDINWARRVAQMLNKTLVVMRLYVSTNPAVSSLKARLYHEIDHFVTTHLSLVMDITDSQLLYEGEPVFKGDDKSRSLPLVLHSDGLRQISFHQGISFDELDDFLRILHEAMTRSEDASDTVGLLWNAGLTNIEYTAVDALEDVADAAGGGTEKTGWNQDGLAAPFADAKPGEVEAAIFQG